MVMNVEVPGAHSRGFISTSLPSGSSSLVPGLQHRDSKCFRSKVSTSSLGLNRYLTIQLEVKSRPEEG